MHPLRDSELARVMRLSWSGIQITAGASTIVINHLEDMAPLAATMGPARERIATCPDMLEAALVTDLFRDHYDPETLRRRLKPGAPVICPRADFETVLRHDLHPVPLMDFESTQVGPFTITALPATDGQGCAQISFLIAFDEMRILHLGDTLWHGQWWNLKRDYGPFDIGFFPVSGALVDNPGQRPSGIPTVLTPEQAAAAADILEVELACPINYGMFEFPPHYIEATDPAQRFAAETASRGIASRILQPGEDVWVSRTHITPD